jgi:hypothetical protein
VASDSHHRSCFSLSPHLRAYLSSMVLHQFLGTLEIIQPVCIGGLLSQTESPFCDAFSDIPDLIQDEISELPKTLNCIALYASTSFLEIIMSPCSCSQYWSAHLTIINMRNYWSRLICAIGMDSTRRIGLGLGSENNSKQYHRDSDLARTERKLCWTPTC